MYEWMTKGNKNSIKSGQFHPLSLSSIKLTNEIWTT